MTETCPFKLNHSALKEKNNSFEEDINIKKIEIERKNSINSSSPKSIIENETDLSYFTIQRQINKVVINSEYQSGKLFNHEDISHFLLDSNKTAKYIKIRPKLSNLFHK